MTQGISKLTSVPARTLPTRMQVPRPRSPWLKRQASAAARRSARFVFEQARVYLSQLKAIEGEVGDIKARIEADATRAQELQKQAAKMRADFEQSWP